MDTQILLGAFAIVVSILIATGTGWVIYAHRQIEHLTKLLQESKTTSEAIGIRHLEITEKIDKKLKEVEVGVFQFKTEYEARANDYLSFLRNIITGDVCYRASDFGGANEYYNKASILLPENLEVVYKLCRAMTYTNNEAEAIRRLSILVAKHPEDANLKRGLALALRFRDPQGALRILDGTSLLEFKDLRLRVKIENERGLLLRDMGEINRAITCHTYATSQLPTDTVSQYFLGIVLMLRGDRAGGERMIRLSASAAQLGLESQSIKPLWTKVIVWSRAVLDNDRVEAKKLWAELEQMGSSYLKRTVESHVNSILGAISANREDFTGGKF